MGVDPLELYGQLYSGSRITFDLTEDGKNCGFKYEKDLTVRSYEEHEFIRSIAFCPEIERIEIN